MSVLFKKGVDNNNQLLKNVADPVSATDGSNKQYVDNVANGRDWHDSVRGASTANLAVASALVNGLSHDGVAYVTGDRILLKNQTAPAENGPYLIVAAGAASRTLDGDSAADLSPGATFTAEEGTVNGDKRFVLTTNAPITLGTTGLTFTVDASGGATYVAGDGLTDTPTNTFNVGVGAGLTVAADAVNLDTAVVARIYQADCVVTTNPQAFTHGLGKRPLVQVIRLSDGVVVIPDLITTTTTVTVDWGAAPSAAEYRVIAVG